MPAQFTLPGTRHVLDPDPPGDMNNVVLALAASGAVCNVLNAAYSGGADPTGASDSQPAFQGAVNAIGAGNTGLIVIPPGAYRLNSTVTVSQAGVYLIGAGMWATTLLYYGSGDCIRMYSSLGYGNGTLPSGGGVKGLILDGTHASAGACGLHAGDIYQLQWDLGARFFQGSGSKGIWLDNQYFWCEDMYGHLFAEQNTTNLIFDNSANLSGQATGSFARPDLTVVMDAKGVGDGIVLKNGAQYYGGSLMYAGNMDYSSSATKHWALTVAAPAGFSYTATNASPCVFTASGHYYGNGTNVFLTGGTPPTGFTNGQSYYVVSTNIGAGTFRLALTPGGAAINSSSTGNGTVETFQPTTLQSTRVILNVECNATNANPQPGTINFTSASSATGLNNISRCTGVIDFSATSVGFAAAANQFGNFFFDGPVYGDAQLQRSLGLGVTQYFNGALTGGQTIFTQGVTVGVVNTTADITGMILQGGGSDTQLFTVQNNGTGRIIFAAAGTSHVKSGTACVIAPNTAKMFFWRPDQFAWYELGAPPSDTLALAPSGATAQTIDRQLPQGYLSSLTSGTVYVSAISLPAGLAVNNLTLTVGNAAFTSVTHGWYALLDSGLVVRAVSSDQAGGNWGSTFTPVTLSVSASAYTTTYQGLYYIAFCATFSGSGAFPGLGTPVGGLLALAPVLASTSSTGQTTPPSTGTTLAALSGTIPTNARFYGYTS